jgi:hypothetical protein
MKETAKKRTSRDSLPGALKEGGGRQSLSIFNLMVVKKKFQKKHKIGFQVHT